MDISNEKKSTLKGIFMMFAAIINILAIVALFNVVINQQAVIDTLNNSSIFNETEMRKVIVRNAIRTAFTNMDTSAYYRMDPFTKEQLIQSKIEENQIITGRLKDANLVPLGYFDTDGYYKSVFK